jgi:Mn-dependent DtxR family transcriptional regulator
VYAIRVTPLRQLAALTEEHFALRLAVRDLEHSWGQPAQVQSLAALMGLSEAIIRQHLEQLDAVGYVQWLPGEDAACFERGMPLLGEIG